MKDKSRSNGQEKKRTTQEKCQLRRKRSQWRKMVGGNEVTTTIGKDIMKVEKKIHKQREEI